MSETPPRTTHTFVWPGEARPASLDRFDLCRVDLDRLDPDGSERGPRDVGCDLSAEVTTLVIGAGGRTGRRVLKLMAGIGLPVIGLARAGAGLKPQPGYRKAEIVGADLLDAATVAPWLHSVRHVIYLAGVSPENAGETATWTTEVLALSHVLAAARSAGMRGSFVYVGVSESRAPDSVAEAHWVVAKRAAEDLIVGSGLGYLIVRATRLTEEPCVDPRLAVSQGGRGPGADSALARDALAPLLVGALVARHAPRLIVDVGDDPERGRPLHAVVQSLCLALPDPILRAATVPALPAKSY